MRMVLISVLLALAALAGIVFTILSASVFTVDGLFFLLILGAMFALFAFNAAYELRAFRAGSRVVHTQQTAPRAQVAEGATTGGVGRQTSRPEAKAVAASAPVNAPNLRRARPLAELDDKPRRPSMMIDGFGAGAVLISDGLAIQAIRMRPEFGTVREPATGSSGSSWAGRWKLVESKSAVALERPLHESGFDIFYLAGRVQGSAWALSRKKALDRALEQVLAMVEDQGRNAIEITHLMATNVLGLHHVTVMAYPRHIQKKRVLLDQANMLPQAGAGQPLTVPVGDKAASSRAA